MNEGGGWTVDTLKELHDREIQADRVLNRVLFGSVAVIVALGWNELQRRLITLNHAHEQQVATLAATVSSEKYDSDKSGLQTRLATIEGKQVASETKAQSAAEEAARLSGARGETVATGFNMATAKRQVGSLWIAGGALLVAIVAVAITVLR